MRLVLKAVLAAATFSILSPAFAADGPKPLFAADTVLNITLSGPFGSLSRDKGVTPVPGQMKVDGTTEVLPVELSTRGITRRRRDICDFPPLRVEFTQKPGKDSLFKGQKRLKLVTHCQAGDKYQQDVLLEYSAYRMYRLLTPYSFNARLALVNYLGEDGHHVTTRPGFFLEDADDVAKRNGQERLKGVPRISFAQLDATGAARFAVFEYMISNLDWAMTAAAPGLDCCHNSRLVGAAGSATGLVPLPYDFDMSGLVDAPYAAPPAGIRVANVRVRLYRGFCAHNAQAQAARRRHAGAPRRHAGRAGPGAATERRPAGESRPLSWRFFLTKWLLRRRSVPCWRPACARAVRHCLACPRPLP